VATVTLEPTDLTPAQAARVLALLNSAASAQALADAIEIPGELDIGVRLAQRLLDARAALGGRFTELAQVRAVRLIGAERFTEICAAALGLDPRRWITQIGNFSDQQAQIEARLARLSTLAESAAAAREGARVDLVAAPQPLWLGQVLELRVLCTDVAGRPLAGRRITVTTSLGTLEAAFGFVVTRAAGITVRTGADGSARLDLRLTPPDGLTAEQQALLEGALDALDPQADSAADLGPALFALAQRYTAERAGTLRAALDLYARQYRGVFVDRLNFGGAGVAFPVETSVLRADLHPTEGAASIAHAVLAAQHRNWVGAWLDALAEYVASQAALDAALAGAGQRGNTGQRLVDDIVAEAQVFVARQPGIAAQWAAQRRVDGAMQRYLARQTEQLDLPTRLALHAQLAGAAAQITPDSIGTLAAVAQAKTELGMRIEQIGGVSGALADEIRGIRSEVATRADEVSRTAAGVAEQAGQVQADRAAVSADRAAVLADRQQVDTRAAEFDSRYSTFTTQYDDFNTRYQGFTVDYGRFQTDYAQFGADATRFRADFSNLDTRVTAAETSISGLQTRTTTLDQQVGTLNTRTGALDQRVTTLDTQRTDLARDLGSLRTDLSRIPR
jgi:DNA uptake protein ComE-like DNA-binding protein